MDINTINAFIVAQEATLRLSVFAGVFIALSLWEILAPRRELSQAKATRWTHNLAIVVISSICVRVLFPASAVGGAVVANQAGWGLFNLVAVPSWLAVALAVIALDMLIYLQHVIFHAVPILWRLHRVHHADLDFDITTGIRFHPLEIILSMLIKLTAIFLLGAPILAVIIFEILLNATSIFNHGNIRLPLGLDRVLRRLIVTPDMHRVHHSSVRKETNSNFGFNLSCWDRIFGTYINQPAAGHKAMQIGLNEYREAKKTNRLASMLSLPFHKK